MCKLKVVLSLFRALVWACAFTLIVPTYAVVFGSPDFNVCLLKGEKEKKKKTKRAAKDTGSLKPWEVTSVYKE